MNSGGDIYIDGVKKTYIPQGTYYGTLLHKGLHTVEYKGNRSPNFSLDFYLAPSETKYIRIDIPEFLVEDSGGGLGGPFTEGELYTFLNYDVRFNQDTESQAVFGQVEYDLTATLSLTAGLRYTRDERDFEYLNQVGPQRGGLQKRRPAHRSRYGAGTGADR